MDWFLYDEDLRHERDHLKLLAWNRLSKFKPKYQSVSTTERFPKTVTS